MKRKVIVYAFTAVALLMCTVPDTNGAPFNGQAALERLAIWMNNHPVMGKLSGDTASITSTFPDPGDGYVVYVVAFNPQGYVVLNSDDRLPLVAGFSANSTIDLSDQPDNAFRALLATHIAKCATQLAEPEAPGTKDATWQRPQTLGAQSQEIFGPYLETPWNQNHPYNLFCPEALDAGAYYDYRAPAGCVPVAYAQILRYHSWPPHGEGAHSYSDTEGYIQGSHAVTFTTPFNWSAMQPSYSSSTEPQSGDEAVADLIYRLGVAAEANYEADDTSSSIETLGSRINNYLFYESPNYPNNQTALLPLLDSDLRNGWPAIVAIPGHAIVADGLLDDYGTVSYHINYGWGGQNNGWWSANGVPGGSIQYGCTSIKPALMAFPQQHLVQAVAGAPVPLEWLVPVTRTGEVSRLLVQQLATQGGAWSLNAETMEHTETDTWELKSGGRSGNCWFAGPNGHKVMTLSDIFVPAANTTLNFWMKYQLGTATFQVLISDDGGDSYDLLYQKNNNYPLTWSQHSVSLGTYVGKQIRVRFELTSGSYYPTTG